MMDKNTSVIQALAPLAEGLVPEIQHPSTI